MTPMEYQQEQDERKATLSRTQGWALFMLIVGAPLTLWALDAVMHEYRIQQWEWLAIPALAVVAFLVLSWTGIVKRILDA